MGDRLLVHIPGSPEDFQTAADYLRDLADGADGLTDDVIAERGAMGAAFQGDGGDAFRERATTLARGGDKLVRAARQAARAIENLGSNLSLVQLQLAVLRVLASDAGLGVTSTHVLAPGPHAEAGLVLSWNSAVEQQRDLVKRWNDSVEDGAAYLEQMIPFLDGATHGFLVDHYEPWRLGNLSPTLSARALDHFADSQRYTDALQDLVEDIDDGDAEDPGDDPLEWYNQVLQRVGAADVDKATDLAGRYLNVVDLFSAGADILRGGQEGQDTADVVFREGAGLFYGAVVSGATGALAGSFGGPIGTVVGFLVGAVSGAVFQEKFEEAYDANTVTVRESDRRAPVTCSCSDAGPTRWCSPTPTPDAGPARAGRSCTSTGCCAPRGS